MRRIRVLRSHISGTRSSLVSSFEVAFPAMSHSGGLKGKRHCDSLTLVLSCESTSI